MKNIFSVVCAGLLLVSFVIPALTLAESLTIGASIPDTNVEMENIDGSMVTIGSVQGEQGTLVYFTCNHCPYVKAWQKRVVPFANSLAARDIGVVAINSNNPESYPDDGIDGMRNRAEEQGMEYPYLVDATSDVARSFGATKTPEFFLFNADGVLVYHGAFDDNAQNADDVREKFLGSAVDALLAGNAIEPSETKSVGCSIKFR